MKKTISQLLLKITARFDPWLFAIFPQATVEEKCRFDLLDRGYVNTRYKRNYSLIRGDLMYLAERVEGFGGGGSHRTIVAFSLQPRQVGDGGDSITWG